MHLLMKGFSILSYFFLLSIPLLGEKVTIQKIGGKVTLLVEGEPFEVHGVGGDGDLGKLLSLIHISEPTRPY